MYTQNQIKVYQNASMLLIEETELLTMEKDLYELLELLDLFGKNEDSPNKLERLYLKKGYIKNSQAKNFRKKKSSKKYKKKGWNIIQIDVNNLVTSFVNSSVFL